MFNNAPAAQTCSTIEKLVKLGGRFYSSEELQEAGPGITNGPDA